MRAILATAACTLSLTLASAPAVAVPVCVTYADGADEGFNDPALGPARRAAFEAAMGQWSEALQGTIPILVKATFDPLGGTLTNALLGAGGANKVAQNFMGARFPNTWYPSALAANIARTDYYPGTPMVVLSFNSDVDNTAVLGDRNWYYGTDGNHGGNVDFYQVALHEFAHGIGFMTFLGRDGNWLVMGGMYEPGVYDQFLAGGPDGSAGRLVSMTQTERAAAAISSNLYFSGPSATALNGGLGAKVYAPGSFASGSSISHLDQGTFQNTASALMCPKYVTLIHTPGPVAEGVLRDLGWNVAGGYSMADAVLALRAASGLDTLAPLDAARLNVVATGETAVLLDLADVQSLVRKAAGLDP